MIQGFLNLIWATHDQLITIIMPNREKLEMPPLKSVTWKGVHSLHCYSILEDLTRGIRQKKEEEDKQERKESKYIICKWCDSIHKRDTKLFLFVLTRTFNMNVKCGKKEHACQIPEFILKILVDQLLIIYLITYEVWGVSPQFLVY